jgi:hypothetical protein
MFYCDRCRRRSGHHRPLAEALQDTGGAWHIGVMLRRGRRAAERPPSAPSPGVQRRQETLHPGSLPTSSGMRRDAWSRTWKLVVQPGRAAQLACPDDRCMHKPREAWATLAKLADEAVAADRRHTYV